MSSSSEVMRYLKRIYEAVREVIIHTSDLGDICSIIIFGSAARPEDFVFGVSDVDVLILVREKPKRRHYEFTVYNSKVDAIILTVNELRRIIKSGDPLAFMLKYSVILYDNCSEFISEFKPKITEHTKRILRRSIFAALSLALENYWIFRNYKKALSHLYHSIRHLSRYKASLKGNFPVSNKEVYEVSEGDLKNTFKKLYIIRKSGITDEDKLKELIDNAIVLIAKELNLKATRLRSLKKVREEVSAITAGEVNNYITFRLEIYEGDKRKIIQIKNNEIKEVESILF